MLRFKFDFRKTLQAAAVLLREHGKQMSHLRLLKLLYIADRELLATTGTTLTGDRAVAMKNGPVLSRVYDLIKQQGAQAGAWDDVIHKTGYTLRLMCDPGTGELSRGEVAKLVELCTRYAAIDDFELADEVTHAFPEWRENYVEGTSTPIPWDDVLKSKNRAAWLPTVESDLAAKNALDAAFGG